LIFKSPVTVTPAFNYSPSLIQSNAHHITQTAHTKLPFRAACIHGCCRQLGESVILTISSEMSIHNVVNIL